MTKLMNDFNFCLTLLKRVRKSGFLSRMASKSGRRIINSRRKKGRSKLTF